MAHAVFQYCATCDQDKNPVQLLTASIAADEAGLLDIVGCRRQDLGQEHWEPLSKSSSKIKAGID